MSSESWAARGRVEGGSRAYVLAFDAPGTPPPRSSPIRASIRPLRTDTRSRGGSAGGSATTHTNSSTQVGPARPPPTTNQGRPPRTQKGCSGGSAVASYPVHLLTGTRTNHRKDPPADMGVWEHGWHTDGTRIAQSAILMSTGTTSTRKPGIQLHCFATRFAGERVTGIEPALSAGKTSYATVNS